MKSADRESPRRPAPLLPLSRDELHLWLSPRDAVADSDRFRREVLSRYAPLAPSEWQFTVGPHGKPAIADNPRSLAFNLSDSVNWRVCAVTAGSAVGVDLERCDAGRDLMRLARRFYQPAEILALASAPATLRVEHFYDYWTLKEAWVKCRGEALGPALAALEFELSTPRNGTSAAPGRIVERRPAGGDRAHYCLLQPVPDYRLAVCWLPGAGNRKRLRLFSPPGAGAGWQPALLATSHSLTLESSRQ